MVVYGFSSLRVGNLYNLLGILQSLHNASILPKVNLWFPTLLDKQAFWVNDCGLQCLGSNRVLKFGVQGARCIQVI